MRKEYKKNVYYYLNIFFAQQNVINSRKSSTLLSVTLIKTANKKIKKYILIWRLYKF